MVQMHGMSVPPKYEGQITKKMKFVPNFFLRDLIGWILAIGVLAALAALFPWELGEKADAFAPAPAGIKPEWYFLFMFQTLKYIPPQNPGSRWGGSRHTRIQLRCVAVVRGAIRGPRADKSTKAADFQHHRSYRAAIHRGDDNCWICNVNLDIHAFSSPVGT